jgi:uncharacterized protein YoxC
LTMSAGGIAAIIAASGLFVIAIAIAYAVIRLSRAIDEVRNSVRLITEDATPLLEEATTTVRLVNGPLQSVNNITKAAEELTVKMSGAASSFLDKNAIAVKLLGTVLSAATKKKSSSKSNQARKSSSKSKSKRSTYNEDEEF